MADDADRDFKYRAFLSYRSSDSKLAHRVHRSLEHYRVPSALVGTTGAKGKVPARLGRIFLDREELRSADDVETIISQELSHSQSLVVLCSPAAASAQSWVGREIELFRKRRPEGDIHALIASGNPPECFPEPLLRRGPDAMVEQPLAADLRKEGDGFHRALTKIVAGLLGIAFDDLWRRERRRSIRRRVLAAAALLVLGAMWFAGLAALDDVERSTELLRLANEPSTDEALRPHLALAALRTEGSLFDFRTAHHPEVSSFVALNRATKVFGDNRRTHSSIVRAAAASPDGSHVVTASDNDDLRMFRGDDMALVSVGPREHTWVSQPVVVYSPTGAQFAYFNSQGKTSVKLWSRENGGQFRVLEGHAERILHAAFSADGSLLATSSRESTVLVWDASTGTRNLTLPVGQRWIHRLAFSPRKHDRVVAISFRGGIQLWNAERGERLSMLSTADVNQIVWTGFSPDARHLVALDDAGTVTTWDLHRGERLPTFHVGTIDFLVASRDLVALHHSRRHLLSPCFVDSACIWDYSNGKLVRRWKITDRPYVVTGTRLSDDGTTVLSISSDGRARLWDANTGAKSVEVEVLKSPGHFDGIFVDRKGRFATFGAGREPRFWDHSGQELSASPGDVVNRIVVSADGAAMATWSEAAKVVKVWSIESMLPAALFRCDTVKEPVLLDRLSKSHLQDLCSDSSKSAKHSLAEFAKAQVAAFSTAARSRSLVVRERADGPLSGVELVDLDSNKPAVLLDGLSSVPRAFAVSPQGDLVAGVSRDLAALVWDAGTGRIVSRQVGHRLTMYDIDFDPTGSKVVATSTTSIRISDARSGRLEKVINLAHAREARFSRSGHLIAVAAGDGSARVYDVHTGIELVRFLSGTAAATESVAWGPEDEWLLMTSGSSVLQFSLRGVDLHGSRKAEACRLALAGIGAFSRTDLRLPERMRTWEPQESLDWQPFRGAELCPCEQEAFFTLGWWRELSIPRRPAGVNADECAR